MTKRERALLGAAVLVVSPEDRAAQRAVDALFARQEANHFGAERAAVLLLPGEYPADFHPQVGFYTELCGLGRRPDEVVLAGLSCPATWMGDPHNHNATCNFWRGVQNLRVTGDVMWAVSQATFMRRMQIDGDLRLHDENGWSSGGFLADACVDGTVDSGSQQQWLSRNCDWTRWTGENWNLVFLGIEEGRAPATGWPEHPYTAVARTPLCREKPYLAETDAGLAVCVPPLRRDTAGALWPHERPEAERVLPLDAFYVAHPGDDADTLNAALEAGRHLLFTPGIYPLTAPLRVTRADTVVMGLGFATLCPTAGTPAMTVADVDGVCIAGLLFDAGERESPALLEVGAGKTTRSHATCPTTLHDLWFRVGGAAAHPTAAACCLTIWQNDVVGDNFWVWRADHGAGVSWTDNRAPTGVRVEGDRVTLYALLVEHYQQYQTIWNGEDGRLVFYQSELPYDVPNDAAWRSPARPGYASYKVGDHVRRHTACGVGIYSFHRDAAVEAGCVMEVPETDGMDIHNVCSVMITGHPGIDHVINDYGDAANVPGARAIVMDYQAARRGEA